MTVARHVGLACQWGKGDLMIGHHLRGVSLAAIGFAMLGLSACATTGAESETAAPSKDKTLAAGLDPATRVLSLDGAAVSDSAPVVAQADRPSTAQPMAARLTPRR